MPSPKARGFLISAGPGSGGDDLRGFLDGLRDDAIIEVQAFSVGGRQESVFILYSETLPKVVGTSPVDGATSIPASQVVRICFDEKIDENSLSGNHISVLENGTAVSPTVNVSNDMFSLVISAVFATGAAYYQIIVRAALPFLSGRTFGQEFLLTFKNA